MKIRKEIKSIGLLGLWTTILMLGGVSATLQASTEEKPNIIFIMLDEWGYYEMSALGHPLIETPNIDRMAEEGMRFTQLLAGGNICAPTRASVMLGQHTGSTAKRDNNPASPIPADEITVAEVLKEAGYATGGFGKWGLGDRGTSGVPEKHGFDVFFGYYNQIHAHTYYPNYLLFNSIKLPLPGNTGHAYRGETWSHDLIHDAAMHFIRDNAGRQPFFAYLPYALPHAFYGIPEDDPAYLKYKETVWDDAPQHHNNPAIAPPDEAVRYAAFMGLADRNLGEILDTLEELGIADNTLVIICGDNGGNPNAFMNANYPNGFFAPNTDPKTGVTFRGGKGNFYEGGLRIAFLAHWPGTIEAGSVTDHLGYFPDFMPTAAELAGVETPERSDGISFVPTLMGKPEEQQQHDYLYWEDPFSVAIRQGDWKAIRPRGSNQFELYDLSTDISESNNIADEHPDILNRLKALAEEAHTPPRLGEVYDESLGFQGHGAR